ncbi:beta-1,6-N-acetylglucosaminyltransferase [Chryseobacterium daecheongense]|uniref:beta-1,6-N-acetylglucosaminyltransferase n=1 Tax=Chryseobacterium daecheongense TaxID=192389 RepID=UPI001FD65360|nr:beta-1,6-N-acetylglucosaminyltransferase [Chryseobacterium daecheongense]UOU98442.1 beta-1,6-N-acetylglucosaminyltransferase [Chryseobacterium daecheongense]
MSTFSPIYQTQPQTLKSDTTRHIRIAYFIMVHHKPERFKAMFAKIYTRDQFYLVHIDRKAGEEITDEIQLYLVQFPNVYILESMNIVSGGFSMIQAELNAMEFLLNVSDDWDYFVNLSGEDYPLKSQDIIRQFLTINNGRNYLFYYDQKFHRPDTLKRIQNHFTELSLKISSFIYKREFMKDVIPYIGGKWVIFTRETCAFLTHNKRVMDFEDYYLHTFLPAESFFQTVLMNTSFNEVIVNDDKRAVIEKPIFNKKQNTDSFIAYLKSSNHLFIRKVGKTTDESILKYVEESYHLPLQEVDEIERELKLDHDQNN